MWKDIVSSSTSLSSGFLSAETSERNQTYLEQKYADQFIQRPPLEPQVRALSIESHHPHEQKRTHLIAQTQTSTNTSDMSIPHGTLLAVFPLPALTAAQPERGGIPADVAKRFGVGSPWWKLSCLRTDQGARKLLGKLALVCRLMSIKGMAQGSKDCRCKKMGVAKRGAEVGKGGRREKTGRRRAKRGEKRRKGGKKAKGGKRAVQGEIGLKERDPGARGINEGM